MIDLLNIMVISGDEILCNVIIEALQESKNNALCINCLDDLNEIQHKALVDIYILNIDFRKEDGYSIRRLREIEKNARIILVTRTDSAEERVRGYEAGVDACLVSPINIPELLACVESLGCRILCARSASDEIAISLSLRTMILTGPAGSLRLSVHEARLLGAMIRSNARQIEHWQIAELIGVEMEDVTQNNIVQRMVRLRRKLLNVGAKAPAILAIHKNGYFLSEPIRLI